LTIDLRPGFADGWTCSNWSQGAGSLNLRASRLELQLSGVFANVFAKIKKLGSEKCAANMPSLPTWSVNGPLKKK
jgi:hypothetical protein